jgi:hypothetical protein
VGKIPKLKVHFKADYPCIFVSEESSQGFFFEAEIYAIEKKKKVEGCNYAEHLMVPFYNTDSGKVLLKKVEGCNYAEHLMVPFYNTDSGKLISLPE